MPEGPPQPLLVQDRYTWVFPDGTIYSDAIVMERNAYQALSAAQVKTLKQNRAFAWKQTVDDARNHRPTEIEMKAARREHRQALQDTLAQVNGDLAQVNADIASET